MVRVGIREFKAHMGQYMKLLRAGETIMLTRRGVDDVMLVPVRSREANSTQREVGAV